MPAIVKSRVCLFLLIIFALSQMLIAGCAQKEKKNKMDESPVSVKVVAVVREDIPDRIAATGNIDASSRAMIGSKLAGNISRIAVEEEDEVAEGDLLMEIDCQDYALQLRQAQAAHGTASRALDRVEAGSREEEIQMAEQMLQQARVNMENTSASYERAQNLLVAGVVSSQELDFASASFHVTEQQVNSAEERLSMLNAGATVEDKNFYAAQVKQAAATVNSARAVAADCKVTSPISGTVVKIEKKKGEPVAPGYPVFIIMDTAGLEVKVNLPSSYSGKIKRGQEATVFVDAYPGEKFSGVVRSASSMVNPTDRTFQAIISLDNEEKKLKPGMHAEVKIISEMRKNALVIPRRAVIQSGEGTHVFTVEAGKSKRKKIETGVKTTDSIEVLSGLEEGDLIVVEGQTGLIDGKKLKAEK